MKSSNSHTILWLQKFNYKNNEHGDPLDCNTHCDISSISLFGTVTWLGCSEPRTCPGSCALLQTAAKQPTVAQQDPVQPGYGWDGSCNPEHAFWWRGRAAQSSGSPISVQDFLGWNICSCVAQMVYAFAADLRYTRPKARVLHSPWVLVLYTSSVLAWEPFVWRFWMSISLAVVTALTGLPEILEQYPESLNSAQAKFPGGKKRTSPWQHRRSLT